MIPPPPFPSASSTSQLSNFQRIFVSFVLEVKKPSKITGTMHVEIPADATKEELEQIQKVLQQTIAQSLGVPLEDIEVKVDPATGEVTYVISTDDQSLADEVTKKLKTDDFTEKINKTLVKNAESLPERIRDKLEIKDVQVNYFF